MILASSSPSAASSASRRPFALLTASALTLLTLFALSRTTDHYSLPSLPTVSRSRSPAQSPLSCPNPILQRSFVTQNKTWLPLPPPSNASSCPLSTSLSDLPSLVPGLKNQTFYFYGDSVLRNAVQHLCGLLNSTWVALPNPPGYLTTSDKQAIHFCTHSPTNFTAVNVYTFGSREWDRSDLPFLRAHPSLNHRPDDDPKIWRFEDRMITPHSELEKRFGRGNKVWVASGWWDLFALQHLVVKRYVESGGKEPQTPNPPADWYGHYAGRLRRLVEIATDLHKGKVEKVFLVTLHNPGKWDVRREWGMNGYEDRLKTGETVKVSCLKEERVAAAREVQYAVGQEMEDETKWRGGPEEGARVELFPMDRVVRNQPDGMKRMLDDIHPSDNSNEFFSLGVAWEGRTKEAGKKD